MRWMALVALAGCDKLLSLGPVTIPPDAKPGCPSQSVFYCADFDQDGPVMYGDHIAVMVPVPSSAGVTALAQAPAVSAPNALWVDTHLATGGHYDLMYSNATTVTKLHAELDLRIDGATPNSSELVEIGVDNAAGSSCHFQLQAHNDQTMRVRWYHCPGNTTQSQELTFFSSIPVGFAHYALDFDIAHMTASVTFNGVTTTDPLPIQSAGGAPFADVGVFAIGGSGGPVVAFDNVLVTATP